MNQGQVAAQGIQTAHGIAGLLLLAVVLVLLFHFIGFRAIFVAGKAA